MCREKKLFQVNKWLVFYCVSFAENAAVKLLEKIAPQMDVGDFSVTAAPTITDVSLKAVVVHIAADLHQEV